VLASIILTIKNEEASIARTLDSLLEQKPPFEIIIVDSESNDDTISIVKTYAKKCDNIHLYTKKTSRGGGRNYGVSKAKGDIICFTDGGCEAHPKWLKELLSHFEDGADVVAGKTIDKGAVTQINRVELNVNGYDVTWPSCNLAYRKEIFLSLNGFDERFITAEDVDLNLRAAKTGSNIVYASGAVIHRESAKNPLKYLKQSFWYGYGRGQLRKKHGHLWKGYSADSMITNQFTPYGIVRLIFGSIGYIASKIWNR
jgi:glycosyltransferase involved in cell wall biosynthesis